MQINAVALPPLRQFSVFGVQHDQNESFSETIIPNPGTFYLCSLYRALSLPFIVCWRYQFSM